MAAAPKGNRLGLDDIIALLLGGQQPNPMTAGTNMPVTPEGVRTPQMGPTNFQPQSLDQARMDAANAPQATPFNPLQNAVDTASMPPVNPLQNAVDTAARPENLANRIPPIGQENLIAPITPENTQGAMTPPITAGNTDLGSMISPITADNTSAPTPTARPAHRGGGGGGGGRPRRPAPAPNPKRDQLARMAAPALMGRAAEAGYTTSGTDPRYAGGSSAIFGRNARR